MAERINIPGSEIIYNETSDPDLVSPKTQVITESGRLGYIDGEKQFVSEPDVVTIGSLRAELVKNAWLIDEHDAWDPSIGLLRKRISGPSDLKIDTEIPKYSDPSDTFVRLGDPRLQAYTDESNEDLIVDYIGRVAEFTDLFNKYIMIKEDNIGEYSRLISSRDILRGTSEVCLLCPKDGDYTNIVNLNSLHDIIQIRVGVAYSKDSVLYSRDTVLVASESRDNYVFTGTTDYKLEYSDGCLRVFPESPDVTECVISYCYATYECLC